MVLKASIKYAPAHIYANAGTVSLVQLKKLFFQNEGFTVEFDKRGQQLTFLWKDMIDLADDILFFGPPLDSNHCYRNIFHWKIDLKYICHIYFHLARQTKGDHISSYAFLIPHQSRMLGLLIDASTTLVAAPFTTTASSMALIGLQ